MNTRPRLRTERVQVFLTEREKSDLLKLSAKRQVRQSELVRIALREYVQRVPA